MNKLCMFYDEIHIITNYFNLLLKTRTSLNNKILIQIFLIITWIKSYNLFLAISLYCLVWEVKVSSNFFLTSLEVSKSDTSFFEFSLNLLMTIFLSVRINLKLLKVIQRDFTFSQFCHIIWYFDLICQFLFQQSHSSSN